VLTPWAHARYEATELDLDDPGAVCRPASNTPKLSGLAELLRNLLGGAGQSWVGSGPEYYDSYYSLQ